MKVFFLLLLFGFFSVSAYANYNIVTESRYDFAKTKETVLEFLKTKDLNVFSNIDHQSGAEKAGMKLGPSTLIIFGNPKIGTQLMQKDARFGLELPMKLHIYEMNKKVFISHQDIIAVSRNYGLGEASQVLEKVSNMFKAMGLSVKK